MENLTAATMPTRTSSAVETVTFIQSFIPVKITLEGKVTDALAHRMTTTAFPLIIFAWCAKSSPFHCDELNTMPTSLSSDMVVCSNQSHWEGFP